MRTEPITIVTGTDTDVGKTVATAALVVALRRAGHRVAVCKPAQTGVGPDGPGDLASIVRLAGLEPQHAHEFARLPEPLAPTIAARRAGVTLPTVAEHAERIAALTARTDTVLVEGAGGVLVGLDSADGTLLDLADALVGLGHRPGFVVVARAGLGTLNHTMLTCDAIRARGHRPIGLIVGAWPTDPDVAEETNLSELPRVADTPVLAVLPAGIGADPHLLRAAAERI